MEQTGTAMKILVGVDGSNQNRAAVGWALREGRVRGEEVVAAHAWHLPTLVYYAPGYVPIATDEMADEGTKLLQTIVGGIPDHEDVKVEMRVVHGSARSALSHIAEEPTVGTVVVGTRGHGSAPAALLGSVSHGLSHHCPKPLVVVPGSRYGIDLPASMRRVLVGVDGSPQADSALRWAADEAKLHGALLEIVTAWSWSASPADRAAEAPGGGLEAAAREILQRSVERLPANGVRVHTRVREGMAPAVLLDMAEEADLLVVGSRGRGRTAEMVLGSTSHQCIHRSPIPVVVVPSAVNDA